MDLDDECSKIAATMRNEVQTASMGMGRRYDRTA